MLVVRRWWVKNKRSRGKNWTGVWLAVWKGYLLGACWRYKIAFVFMSFCDQSWNMNFLEISRCVFLIIPSILRVYWKWFYILSAELNAAVCSTYNGKSNTRSGSEWEQQNFLLLQKSLLAEGMKQSCPGDAKGFFFFWTNYGLVVLIWFSGPWWCWSSVS